jgi:hypothetical protein
MLRPVQEQDDLHKTLGLPASPDRRTWTDGSPVESPTRGEIAALQRGKSPRSQSKRIAWTIVAVLAVLFLLLLFLQPEETGNGTWPGIRFVPTGMKGSTIVPDL